ncbi:hypothetical protein PHLCEN_2v11561 [Hermanssonia centrifuga]|uniref:Uncharacterized protein n=1 Tax=Hermanssonia centrifuga TaxID=98765 RepID=A0A2R6NJZ8_9APHY|nr:hypothetical protein PHLCEN_2v11561 [Hermanssonia centrifuga]
MAGEGGNEAAPSDVDSCGTAEQKTRWSDGGDEGQQHANNFGTIKSVMSLVFLQMGNTA